MPALYKWPAARPHIKWVRGLSRHSLGTALGDWTADTGGLGYERGALSSLPVSRCSQVRLG
jgi:uncharacterized membrane-anchored protein